MQPTTDYQDEKRREEWREFVHSLSPEIDPDTVRLMDQFLHAFHGLHRVSESSLTSSGLSFAKYRLLLRLMLSEEIDKREDLNPSELSRREGTSRNTISALIRDLEGEELIERRLDQKDRRRFNIRLTESGRDLVRSNAAVHFQAIASCFRKLNKSEKQDLGRLLSVLSESAYPEATSKRIG